MFDIAKKKAFVCDLDGTLFMGGQPIKGAVDFVIESTKSERFSFFYLTNNTSKTPEEYMTKISGAAIPVKPEQILTPLITLEAYIREKGYKSVYLLASEKVVSHMEKRLADVGVSFEFDPEKNELIALAYDKELTYAKLADATSLWNMRNVPPSPMCPVRTENKEPIDFVATHPDNCCPSERGPIPDVGGMLKFLEITNGMKPTHVFGKPSPSLLKTVLDRFAPEEIAVVGDRLYTDKAIADNAGVDFVCVLSGETTKEDLEKYTGTAPAIVVDTFDMVDAK
ncbi:MAG: HAD hydrolase-like protein [Kiritimatiellae bacterium]|jgi:HAD superfamily hydrolase (TIGR01450 family)|nr:HAD hydrolase-like protein [Kiritimatiellia bacterium]